jgi:hypothetical protein
MFTVERLFLLASSICLCFGLLSMKVLSESWHLSSSSQLLAQSPKPQTSDLRLLQRLALHRVQRYEQLLQTNHLAQGMVVNRTLQGEMLDQCDSLIFSSLRYVALKKLGLESDAELAWEAIRNSRNGNTWVRHPTCPQIASSRDQLLGLFTSVALNPPGSKQIVRQLLQQLRHNNGFFADGAFHVSMLSPNLGRILYSFAQRYQLSEDLPFNVALSFSTAEIDSALVPRGYQSHLIGLSTLIELELAQTPADPMSYWNQRSLLLVVDPLLGLLTKRSLLAQRTQWVTYNLSTTDPENLFFAWLRLRAGQLLTPAREERLLHRLLQLFPEDRLPQDCDRYADYLWQRDSVEYKPKSKVCTKTFAGVDFTFMAALLVEPQATTVP